MDRYVTIFIKSKGDVKQCEKDIKSLRRDLKGIAAVRTVEARGESKNDQDRADIMVEVRLDKNVNLESIKQRLDSEGRKLVATIVPA